MCTATLGNVTSRAKWRVAQAEQPRLVRANYALDGKFAEPSTKSTSYYAVPLAAESGDELLALLRGKCGWSLGNRTD
eukprot:198903-Rhodomonas_salina.1